MKRIYKQLISHHLQSHQQMVFLSGPRQSGKTTLALSLKKEGQPFYYLNWDDIDTRRKILEGPRSIADLTRLHHLSQEKALIIFDELHKYTNWKTFLKGFYDLYKDKAQVVVTGSAKLNVYQKGGDSLMGRYLHYHIFPLTLSEASETHAETAIPNMPSNSGDILENLRTFGGFPEPFLKKDPTFHHQWTSLRRQQLFKEDILELTHIREAQQMEVMALVLREHSGDLLNRTTLSKHSQVSVSTISKWLSTLESFYYCFLIHPWSRNIPRSLLKEPMCYLYDWSMIPDKGKRTETLVANHLLKAIRYWTDSGQGTYSLHFVRDKEKREVDFLVTRNDQPWFLVEVKHGDTALSKNLSYFHEKLGTEHAFQVVYDLPYVEANCFEHQSPVVVPAKTFLSQLV